MSEIIPFVIRMWERDNPVPLVDHAMDLKGRPVLIKFPVGTLGDLIGWFSYAEKFLERPAIGTPSATPGRTASSASSRGATALTSPAPPSTATPACSGSAPNSSSSTA